LIALAAMKNNITLALQYIEYMRYIILLLGAVLILSANAQEQPKDIIILKDSSSHVGHIKKLTDSTVVISNGAGVTQKFNRSEVLSLVIANKYPGSDTIKKVAPVKLITAPRNVKIAGALGIAGTTFLITGFIMAVTANNAKFSKPEPPKNLYYAGLAFTGTGLVMDLGAFVSLFAGGKKMTAKSDPGQLVR
jgi:hypothetical protein